MRVVYLYWHMGVSVMFHRGIALEMMDSMIVYRLA